MPPIIHVFGKSFATTTFVAPSSDPASISLFTLSIKTARIRYRLRCRGHDLHPILVGIPRRRHALYE